MRSMYRKKPFFASYVPVFHSTMNHTIAPFLRRHIGPSALAGALFATVGFLLVLFVGPDYSVRTDYLISQEGAETKDYYTLTRSAEYMSKVLTEVVGSERFIAAVIDTGETESGFLPQDKREKLSAWKRMVRVDKRLDLGIVSVTVSSDDLQAAQRVALGVSEVFTEKNGMFLGTGERNVPVSVLSGPIAERNPGAVRMLLAILGGFVGGLLLFLLAAFLRDEFDMTRGTAFRTDD